MSEVIISVEKLSKQYRLGTIGTGTLSHDINRYWAKLMGKDDPYALVGDVNDRTKSKSSDYVWALKDVNFDVKRGDVVGIIGKNGAGKSTLLKIMSQITSPTHGSIKIKGRVASLLEVGTGFHPDLTGRENVFLNGAILGMRKWEIAKKLDEIVSFAGTEKYIDTPVKRYSSGMKVRLGFAVAAHLEPEILIVDEVLAVGDAEFQKKCLGKMDEISKGGGRTILFVSHNLTSVKQICNRGILIANGTVGMNGSIDQVIDNYLGSGSNKMSYDKDSSDKPIFLKSISVDKQSFHTVDDIQVKISVKANRKIRNISISCIAERVGVPVFCSFSTDSENELSFEEGEIRTLNLVIKKSFLKGGLYFLNFSVRDFYTGEHYDKVYEELNIHILDSDIEDIRSKGFSTHRPGSVIPNVTWNVSN